MALPNRDTASTYQALAKQNYLAVPPSDILTDWDNPSLAVGICNIAGITLVVSRVVVQMTLATTTGGLILNNWYAVWKNCTPTLPTLNRISQGIFTITLPAAVSDEYNASVGVVNNNAVNLQLGFGNLESPGSISSASVSCSANIITIKTYNSSGLDDFSGVVLDVAAI